MNENRRQILEMLAAGQISADEAERLISALEKEPPAASPADRSESGPSAWPKYLRVVVEAEKSGHVIDAFGYAGEHATRIGKLVKGAEPMKPGVEAFVDEEAGPDVAGKARRRLQHFVDRQGSTLFEPQLAVSRDEALTGRAPGGASRT